MHSGADNVTSGTGELSIEDGKYSAYGRQLDIQRGRLIFNGGVVDEPGIDIRAVKVFPDVTAGINVRGSLRQPRISYFSDPSLTQSQILSLLLAGGSLESVQNRQNGAAAQLIAQGGAMLAQQFGSKVGIQDVGLESDLTERHLARARPLSLAASVHQLRRQPHAEPEYGEAALHPERPLDHQDRGGPGARRRPRLHHSEVTTRRSRAGARGVLTASALICKIRATLCRSAPCP